MFFLLKYLVWRVSRSIPTVFNKACISIGCDTMALSNSSLALAVGETLSRLGLDEVVVLSCWVVSSIRTRLVREEDLLVILFERGIFVG